MIIYLVTANGGRWDEWWTTNVKAFTTKEAAEEFVTESEDNIKPWVEKAERIVEEFEGKSDRVIDIKIALEDERDSYYLIEEVEMVNG